MRRYPSLFYFITRLVLRIILPLYLDFKYRFKGPIAPGAKIIVGNHPTVWDVFPGVIMFNKDIIHTLVEEQIWSFPLVRMVLAATNQIKMCRGVQSMRSMSQALEWLRRGHALVVSPEGERTPITRRRTASRGVVWLALKARVPVVPVGIWVPERSICRKRVRYHFNGRRYSVESYFPRFRGKYSLLAGKPIHFDRYYGRKLSLEERQNLADGILQAVYRLREEAAFI